MSFNEEKIYRTNQFYRYDFGQIEQKCLACNGSGHYDNHGSPDCGCCNGTGIEKVAGKKSLDIQKIQKEIIDNLKIKHNQDLLKVANEISKSTNNYFNLNLKEQSGWFLNEYISACAFIIAKEKYDNLNICNSQ